MNKLLKSRKALSPVIASIILVAVTVAVSIAVAVWMGALTFSFTHTDQFNINLLAFGGTTGNAGNYINMTIQNTGSSPWTLSSTVQVNGKSLASPLIAWTGYSVTVQPGNNTIVKIQNVGWLNGNQYSVLLITTSGTKITDVGYAPSS